MSKILIPLCNYAANAANVAARGKSLVELKAKLAEIKKQLAPAQRIDTYKQNMHNAPSAKVETLRKKIAELRERYNIGPRRQSSVIKREIEVLEKTIVKRAENAKLSKQATTKPAKKPAVQKDRGEHVVTPKAAAKKLSEKVSKTPAKVVLHTDKKGDSALKAAQTAYDKVSKQLEKDMPPSKKSRLRSERARLRVMVADLKRGQKASNKATKPVTQAQVKAELKAVREQLKGVKEGSAKWSKLARQEEVLTTHLTPRKVKLV